MGRYDTYKKKQGAAEECPPACVKDGGPLTADPRRSRLSAHSRGNYTRICLGWLRLGWLNIA